MTATTTRRPWRRVRRNGASVAHAFTVFADSFAGSSACGLVAWDRADADRLARPMPACKSCVKSVTDRWDGPEPNWEPWTAELEADVLEANERVRNAERFQNGDFPWLKNHLALVVNDGYTRIDHAFDLAAAPAAKQPSMCDLAEMENVESYEVDGPEPTMCRRCHRLLAIEAGVTPPTATMEDVRDERRAAGRAAYRISTAESEARLERLVAQTAALRDRACGLNGDDVDDDD